MEGIMTRKAKAKATARLEESKLQITLQELRKYKHLCEVLQGEQDDNEKEVLNILNNNSKLKCEMAELHNQLINITEQRDKLQHLVNQFDRCSDEFDTTLKHNTELKCRLSEAQDTIIRMESVNQIHRTEQTYALFDKLVGATPLQSADSHSNGSNQIMTIDLTSDNSIGSTSILKSPIKHIIGSKTKLKKYIKINKIINKTKKMIKNNKNCFSKYYKSYNSCKQLKSNFNDTKNNYEADLQHLQSRILHLQDSLTAITSKYETSQKEMGEYILAMNSLVELCGENERIFNSLSNNQSQDIKYELSGGSRSADSHESSSSSLLNSLKSTSFNTQKVIDIIQNDTKNKNKLIMYSDEIGQNMCHKLNQYVGDQVMNYCMPEATYEQILDKITSSSYCPTTTLIILIGRRGNASVETMIQYLECLSQLNLNQIVLFAFPYGKGLSQAENKYRYKCNMKLQTMTFYNEKINFIDSNVLINENYFLTKDNYYLCNFYKGQIAKSLSYCIFNRAKCSANYTASIEQSDSSKFYQQNLELDPSNLNYNMRQ